MKVSKSSPVLDAYNPQILDTDISLKIK